MQPEQTLQAHIDLKGRWLLPIHNGTFDLAMHAWHEPFDRMTALAAERGIALATPQMASVLIVGAAAGCGSGGARRSSAPRMGSR